MSALIQRFGAAFSRWAQRLVPDPFLLALGLTLLVMFLGAANLTLGEDVSAALFRDLAQADAPPDPSIFWTVFGAWLAGFANPGGLAFALQMCLVLVTGHALATSPPVQSAVDRIAQLPRDTASAAALVAGVGCLASVVHWGLGAIVGALLAREIARNATRRGLVLHYPLLGAAAYAGFAVWHGGLSGSAPLKVAEDGHFLQALIGVISVRETLFSNANLLVTGVLVVGIPLLFWALAPRPGAEMRGPAEPLEPLPAYAPNRESGVVSWLQDSLAIGTLIGASGLLGVAFALRTDRLELDINSVNLLFLFSGLALQGRVGRYVQAVADGARGVGGIVLQFPFYFAILGVMKETGLITAASHLVADAATADTFPILAFLSAGFVNLFVPSGGGQWVVQGDILVRAGKSLGVAPRATVMAFAYGDAWTNMLQPFWALPLLGIMGLRARDIIGYTAILCVAMGLVVPFLLWIAY